MFNFGQSERFYLFGYLVIFYYIFINTAKKKHFHVDLKLNI